MLAQNLVVTPSLWSADSVKQPREIGQLVELVVKLSNPPVPLDSWEDSNAW